MIAGIHYFSRKKRIGYVLYQPPMSSTKKVRFYEHRLWLHNFLSLPCWYISFKKWLEITRVIYHFYCQEFRIRL